MTVIYIVLPLAIVMAGVALAAFFWAVHRGQFDDLDTPRYRALFEETSTQETHDLKPITGATAARENLN
jgi:cbb3-type cytochrome oxidase maturation protein